MDVITGDFKDLASCFLLNINRSGNLAVLAGHNIYGLVKLDTNLTQVTKKLRETASPTLQDIKFCKGQSDNIVAEASGNSILLHDVNTELVLQKKAEFRAHTRDLTSIDWNEQKDLLGKNGQNR